MALDIGEKRVGVAISDTKETVASAICVLNTQDVVGLTKNFKRVLEDWEPDALLFGKPKTLHGEEGPQAKRVIGVSELIVQKTGIKAEFFDERLTSKEAKNFMRECGMSEKEMRGKIDMVAAQIFLQSFLDKKRNENFRIEANDDETLG